jgi:hypothetical protein
MAIVRHVAAAFPDASRPPPSHSFRQDEARFHRFNRLARQVCWLPAPADRTRSPSTGTGWPTAAAMVESMKRPKIIFPAVV